MAQILAILTKLGWMLLTEKVIKKVIIVGLEQLVKKTKTDADDQLLQTIKEAWDER